MNANYMADAKKWLLEQPLFKPLPISPDKASTVASILMEFRGKFDCFCTACGSDSTFTWCVDEDTERQSKEKRLLAAIAPTGTSGNRPSPATASPPTEFFKKAVCARDASHVITWAFIVRNGTIIKFGQYPSRRDQFASLYRRFRPLLNKQLEKDLLQAHGLEEWNVGAAAFLYLRRVFEGLITEAEQVARDAKENLPEDFKSLRMNEKIAALAHHLPGALVQDRTLYGILSEGIHQLSDEDCARHYFLVKEGILLILEDKLTQHERTVRAREYAAAKSEFLSNRLGSDSQQ